jgi:hypothetical protein
MSKGFNYEFQGSQISLKQFNRLSDLEKQQCKKVFIDNTQYNVSCDTETETQFFIVKGKKTIRISKEEFTKYENENIKWGQNLDLSKIRKLELINKKKPYQLLEKTRVKVIQACFRSPDGIKFVIWVDESKKDHYGKDKLKYTYEQKLKDKSVFKDVETEIIYSKNIIKDFYQAIEGFTRRENSQTSKTVKTNIWFHNLKFDMLNIGLLDRIQENKWQLKAFSNNTPRFYKFHKIAKFKNSKGKVISNEITFLDSFNFFTFSLANLGKQIGIRKEKEKTDFDKNDNFFN